MPAAHVRPAGERFVHVPWNAGRGSWVIEKGSFRKRCATGLLGASMRSGLPILAEISGLSCLGILSGTYDATCTYCKRMRQNGRAFRGIPALLALSATDNKLRILTLRLDNSLFPT